MVFNSYSFGGVHYPLLMKIFAICCLSYLWSYRLSLLYWLLLLTPLNKRHILEYWSQTPHFYRNLIPRSHPFVNILSLHIIWDCRILRIIQRYFLQILISLNFLAQNLFVITPNSNILLLFVGFILLRTFLLHLFE